MNALPVPPADVAGDEGEPPSSTGHHNPADDEPRSPAHPSSTQTTTNADARGGAVRLSIDDTPAPLGAERLAALRDLASRAIAATRATQGDVRVRVVGDAEMTDAHRRYLGDATTTDVITFDSAGDADAPLDVDILVCLDVAQRTAAAHGRDPAHELTLYILHGVLHCLGHDDTTPDAFDAMHAEEDRILGAIGLGAVFADGEADR